jgi:SAM-dependent methyltransferase
MLESRGLPGSSGAKRPIRSVRRNGIYGIDAPYLLPVLGIVILVHVASGVISQSAWPWVGAVFILACAGFGLHASLWGKFAVWAELLDGVELNGDERVLDLGCGRGAVLLLAAQHLTTGRAFGVDIWRRRDQSGNEARATRNNADAERVSDRVELLTANMAALPFGDACFDLIVSSLAIHNVNGRHGREQAIDEAVRVLRPGGRLMIADLWAADEYRNRLAKLGMLDVTRRDLGWRMWWSGPWLPTHLIAATKPSVHAPEGTRDHC